MHLQISLKSLTHPSHSTRTNLSLYCSLSSRNREGILLPPPCSPISSLPQLLTHQLLKSPPLLLLCLCLPWFSWETSNLSFRCYLLDFFRLWVATAWISFKLLWGLSLDIAHTKEIGNLGNLGTWELGNFNLEKDFLISNLLILRIGYLLHKLTKRIIFHNLGIFFCQIHFAIKAIFIDNNINLMIIYLDASLYCLTLYLSICLYCNDILGKKKNCIKITTGVEDFVWKKEKIVFNQKKRSYKRINFGSEHIKS